jgi:Ni/Co efflux regulator RcnB
MKRFLIATAVAALIAPTLAAPSFAQDQDGRGRGGGRSEFNRGGEGRGDFNRGGNADRGNRGGGRPNFGRSDQQYLRGNPPPQRVQPAPQAAAPQAPQAQFQDRGGRRFEGGQRPDRGQFQGRRDFGQGQFQGRQFQGGQPQAQGRRDFDRDRREFDNRRFDGRQFDNRQLDNRRFDNRQGFAGRGFDNRFDNRRYQGPPPRGGQRFSYNGRNFYRFRSTPYVWPRGYNYGSFRWTLNSILPSIFLNQSYYIDPYAYGLPWADPGYQWVQVGNDALLIDTFTGLIVDIVPGVFYW